MTVIIETKPDTPRTAELAAAFAGLLSQRIGVQMQVELAAPGATAPFTQVDSRQKPLRLIDERPKSASP
jgi:phenylacetate-CoA ligase